MKKSMNLLFMMIIFVVVLAGSVTALTYSCGVGPYSVSVDGTEEITNCDCGTSCASYYYTAYNSRTVNCYDICGDWWSNGCSYGYNECE